MLLLFAGTALSLDLLGGSPLSDTAPPFPAFDHPQQPTALWGDIQGPHQTNSWWENLVLFDGNNVVSPLPFLVKAKEEGLIACMPSNKVKEKVFVS